MPTRKSWYEIAEGPKLAQGDLFRQFPIAKPPKNIEISSDGIAKPSPTKIEIYDVVVLTQSCDLENNKTGLVLVSPFLSLAQIGDLTSRDVRENPERLKRFKEQIRRGAQPPFHMLDRCSLPAFRAEVSIVDFRYVFTVSTRFLERMAQTTGPRLRLKSPFREHLSQAFARYFMRVGLPSDIPPFAELP